MLHKCMSCGTEVETLPLDGRCEVCMGTDFKEVSSLPPRNSASPRLRPRRHTRHHARGTLPEPPVWRLPTSHESPTHRCAPSGSASALLAFARVLWVVLRLCCRCLWVAGKHWKYTLPTFSLIWLFYYAHPNMDGICADVRNKVQSTWTGIHGSLFQKDVVITISEAVIWSTPSTAQGTRLGALKQTQRVRLLSSIDLRGHRWHKIVLGSIEGYVRGQACRVVKGEKRLGVLTTSRLNLRRGGSTRTRVITTLDQGELLFIKRELANGWLEVRTDEGLRGFVSARYVKTFLSKRVPG